ncbi:hypothetical protein [Kitasatospora griseola]|uniref:hypothetical protein n=1 Tax=Kitasatospora griseola TaxID=2064 RepID=UPI00364CA4B7
MAILVLFVLRAGRRADRENGPGAARRPVVVSVYSVGSGSGSGALEGRPAVDGAVRPARLGSPRGAAPECGRALCALQGQ